MNESPQEFLLVFQEGDNGPYEVRGRAFAVYRAYLLIGHKRGHIKCRVLDENRKEVSIKEFMDACVKDVQASNY